MKQLTNSMLKWLDALARGVDPVAQFKSRSQHGGADGTLWGLRRRGLINSEGEITGAGRDALAARQRLAPEQLRVKRLRVSADITRKLDAMMRYALASADVMAEGNSPNLQDIDDVRAGVEWLRAYLSIQFIEAKK